MKHNRNEAVIIRSETRTSPDGLVITRWNYVQRGLYAGWEMDEVLSMRKPKAVAKEEKAKRGRPVECVPRVDQRTTQAKAKGIDNRRTELAKMFNRVPSMQLGSAAVVENGERKLRKEPLKPNPECQHNRKAGARLNRRVEDWKKIYSGTKTPPMGAYHCPGSMQ